jgi:hypothetical protein
MITIPASHIRIGDRFGEYPVTRVTRSHRDVTFILDGERVALPLNESVTVKRGA